MNPYNIILGLTGSVATTLHKKIVEHLSTIGTVTTIVTEKAKHFIEPEYLKTYLDDSYEWKNYPYKKNDAVGHIELAKNNQIMVIAPASANTIAKLANGFCDNLLTSVATAFEPLAFPMIVCPSMNTHMYFNAAIQDNIAKLRKRGIIVIDPQEKLLACGDFGIGAMCDISKIVAVINEKLKWCFPLLKCNAIPVMPHPGAFKFNRKGHIHTGIDLYIDEWKYPIENMNIHAVQDGKIISIEPFTGPSDNSPWWLDTECILVQSASGTICYGELTPDSNVKTQFLSGRIYIKKGQLLGKVKRVIKSGKEHPEITGWMPNMLHFEIYKHGIKTVSAGYNDNLVDPTPYILNCKPKDVPIVTYDKYSS